MNLEQFQTAPSAVLVDLLMDAMTCNSKDALYALRREYEFDEKELDEPFNGKNYFTEYDGIHYIVSRVDGKLIVDAEYRKRFRHLCTYTENSKELAEIEIIEVPENGPHPANGVIIKSEQPEETTQESIQEEPMETNNETEVKPEVEVKDETPVQEEQQPAVQEESDVPEVVGKATIPDIHIETKLEEEDKPKEKVLADINAHSPDQYLQMLIGCPFPNYLDVKRFIIGDQAPGSNFHLTGSTPVEHVVVFDDYTFSIIKMNEGQFYRILVKATNDDEEPSFLASRNVPNRWMFIADVSQCVGTRSFFSNAGWGNCIPGTFVGGIN